MAQVLEKLFDVTGGTGAAVDTGVLGILTAGQDGLLVYVVQTGGATAAPITITDQDEAGAVLRADSGTPAAVGNTRITRGHEGPVPSTTYPGSPDPPAPRTRIQTGAIAAAVVRLLVYATRTRN